MRILAMTFAAMALACAASIAIAAETQDCPERELVKAGTFEAEVTSAGLIVGVRWGEGVLTLNDGKTYKFSLSGAKVMEIGAAKKHLVGTVYNLSEIAEFPGIFLGIGGGLTAITKGLGGVSITNGKCVVMNASAEKSTGLQASMPIAPGGVQIKLAE